MNRLGIVISIHPFTKPFSGWKGSLDRMPSSQMDGFVQKCGGDTQKLLFELWKWCSKPSPFAWSSHHLRTCSDKNINNQIFSAKRIIIILTESFQDPSTSTFAWYSHHLRTWPNKSTNRSCLHALFQHPLGQDHHPPFPGGPTAPWPPRSVAAGATAPCRRARSRPGRSPWRRRWKPKASRPWNSDLVISSDHI